RHGHTLGSPLAVRIDNSEWSKWTEVMSPDPVEDPGAPAPGRGPPLTRPRPGHADLTGMQKYGFDEARPVLERASARETAARVAAGAGGKALRREVGGAARPPLAGRARPRRPGGDRRLPGPLPGRRGRGADDGRGRRGQGGRRHPRRSVRGGRPRPAARSRLLTPPGPQAGRPPGPSPDEHPGPQGGL